MILKNLDGSETNMVVKLNSNGLHLYKLWMEL